MAKKRVIGDVVESDRAVTPRAQALPQGRSAAGPRPRLPGGDHLRAQDRHALADAADPPGVRQRQHLLAPLPRLDADWGSGPNCTGGCCACSAGAAGSTSNAR